MPSGKNKSKENTWTEKDLTEALQGDKPRRSKDGSRGREPKEDSSQKRHSKERSRDEQDKDRRGLKQEKLSRVRDKSPLEDGAGSSSGTKSDRKSKDRTNGKDSGSGTREKQGSDDKDKRRKERNDDGGRERGKQREREGSGRSHHKEGELKEDDKRRKDEKRRGKEGRDLEREHDERKRDKDRDDRKRDREHDDRKRDREHDDRKRERNRESEKGEGRRGKAGSERRIEKRVEERNDDGDDDRERERRRRKQEERDRRNGAEDNGADNWEEENKEKERGGRRKKREERDGRHGNLEDGDDYEKEQERRKKREARNDRDGNDKMGDEDEDELRRERRRRRRREERREKEKSENNDKETKEQKFEENKQYESQEGGGQYGHKEVSRSLSTQSAAEVAEDIANDYKEDNYEDDFEDYEDDFEDADDDDDDDNDDDTADDAHDKGKLLEIFEAINAENSDVARMSPYPRTPTEDSRQEDVEPVRKPARSPGEGRINFVAAKQKHVNAFVASKTKKRAQELENLIELDVASYDIFDLPPLNEYELYIKSYGHSDSKQAYVQCHDDIVEKEMQTEEIEISTKWTQYPPDGFKGYGGDEDNDKDLIDATFSPHSVDSVKLSNFLQQAGQVCLILLEEMTCGKTDLMFKERNDINISDGFIQLGTRLSFLEGRRILDVHFNSIQTHILLTAHDLNEVSSDDCLHGKGVVCFWNVNEPTQPQKILFCESSPRSCCFSPIKSSLVFAGLDDGSIVIWDIRETSSLHCTKKDKDNQWVVRRPTFSTAGVFNNENHTSPIRTILPISLPKESAQASMRTSFAQDDLGCMAFQLASLEENGCVNIWVVIELDNSDEAGSESDLGMAPGGRIKLVKSTTIQVESPHREIFTGSAVQSFMMQFSTEDSNHFYVATDRGWVVHCTRYGGKTQPKTYRPDIDLFVTVSAMDVSPWSIPILLVGCADGSVRLHDLHKEMPIRSWAETTKGNPVTQMMWSRSRPSLFYVLDSESNLYIWDLLQKDGGPIATESFKRGRLLSFSLSNDYECLGIGLPGRKSELVLNYEGGIVELHRLKETVTSFQADELDKFASLVDSFI